METSSVTAYKDVEKRFSQSHDIDDALFLARSYYKKGNYKKAEHWALETNKVDPNMEESILIFVKSKIKLGRKNEAISILKSYLKRSNSQEAINLLHHIENNKI
jgi:tetratricopeptide (TPR) repeat protein